jgi:hypothetical protein
MRIVPLLWGLLTGPLVGEFLTGSVVDAGTGEPVAARLYIEGADGRLHHARAATTDGSAVPYRVQRGPASVEVHTSLSAHPFAAELPPGRYTLTAERGKEYHPETIKVDLESGKTREVTIRLRRWTNMASRGWFSGETHVHRTVSDLPVLMLAEDLNVAFPLTAWVTDSRAAPAVENKNPGPVPPARLIEVDPTHVIWPVNTEYEIFTVDGSRHTLGAVFILNHREPFQLTAPPVKPIAAEARRQGGLLDLDKHNWPWSMMLIPTMGVDLFELSNNHIWRTDFMFSKWNAEFVADHMDVERVDGLFTERGWIDFGFLTYYALLNCGFDLKPTAGTASGVHPVPLGFGRVYVKLDGAFSYEKWIEGLTAGRSFVTTGPMLMVDCARNAGSVVVRGTVEGSSPPDEIEVVMNGSVVHRIDPQPEKGVDGSHRVRFEAVVPLEQSSWIAVRVFERRSDKRPRFAHSAPVHFEVAGKPLRPRKADVSYLIKRIEDESERHTGVLPPAAMAEYREALAHYRGLLETAR